MTLADVARPTAGTSGTSGCSERYGILTAQRAYAFQTAVGDDVAGKHFVVFPQCRAQPGDELLHLLYEVGGDVVLYASDGVVVLNQSSAGSRLEDVENLFAVAESVEESGQGSQVHAQAGEEEQVRVDALQFVHDGTDVLHAVAHLDAHRLFDAHTECVPVVMGAQIVQAVGQCQGLRIGEAFAHLLDAPVNVSAVYVQLLDDFPFEGDTEPEYAVGGGMLRTDIDDVFILCKDDVTLLDDTAVGQFFIVLGGILRLFVGHAERVQTFVIILAERMAYPVFAQVQAAHVGVSDEADAEEVVCFAFVQLGSFPDVAYAGQLRMLPMGRNRPHRLVLAGGGLFQVIDHAQSFLAPVHTGERAEEVVAIRPQFRQCLMYLFRFYKCHILIVWLFHHGVHGVSQRPCLFFRRYTQINEKLCVTRWHSVVNLSGSHHRRIFPISLYVATASCHTARPPVVEDIPGYIHPRAESYRLRSTRGNSS